jgi:hypothetical protein
LQRVHTAFARGNYAARAEINFYELQPLALSLNLLLAHMERLLREHEQRLRVEMAARELSGALHSMRAGAGYVSPQYTGTAFDEVLFELLACYQEGLLRAGSK